ncbi:hypothetical protein SEVIR_2G067300v4 [Setaria viridis]|uniref:F-box domain-containing protein n=1 Tax=Setaria viridis TaxID=4556 RepID=A0A4U6VQT5_SETVI|nr:hypothetical protein SEVIR_2G067300v2 [Setaria viridis]
MEPSLHGAQLAAKSSEDDAGMDRLSALPNDVLLRILLRLEDAAVAGRTSVLSSRWRRLWALLPELRFHSSREPRLIASALLAHEAALSCLDVGAEDAAPESVAAWLPVAARRLSGSLVFTNRVPGKKNANEDGEERGAFELPCLANATGVSLDLGCLGVSVPRAGVFARLTELSLSRVQFRGGPCALGDAVSSRRCPCLEKLTVRDALGPSDLAIRSDSLRHMELADVRGLRRLTVVVPALEHLTVVACFYHHHPNRPVANITARQLKELRWGDMFDRRSVQLGKMKHLQCLCPDILLVYGSSPNRSCIELLRCFKVIQKLSLTLIYPPDIDDQPYLLGDMKILPGATLLHLSLTSNGHAFGASLFHVLRLCSGTRKLALKLFSDSLEEQTVFPPGCICDEQQNWKTEELLLNQLRELEITELRGSENEVTFVKQLFKWATVLKRMKLTFNSLVKESVAERFYKILQSFSRPEICMEFYMYKDMMEVLYAPED